MAVDRIGVLFVCLGNICRSPLAETVFRALVERAGLADRFDIDSAGTSSYHTGEAPDPRTVDVAKRHGMRVDHVARQVTARDLDRFDYVLAMDRENLRKLERATGGHRGRAEVRLLRSFDPEAGEDLEVPDPYFGGPRGFEEVHAMVERACRSLLDHIRAERLA
jgi:protein-tyrosine phosphatase